MALFKLNDLFGYQDANEIKKLWASATAPTNPEEGEIWLDTTLNRIKRYVGSVWVIIGELSAADLLTLIKTVDGTASGLDADTVDSIQAASFVRKDSDTTMTANTLWQNSKKIKLGTASDVEFYSDGTNVYMQLNKVGGRLAFILNQTGQAVDIQSALVGTAGSHSNHPLLRIRQTADTTYNIGDIHGEIQFYSDDTAVGPLAFVRAITTRGNGLTAPDAGLAFGVGYNSGAVQEVMRLDSNGNLHLAKDQSLAVGASDDLTLQHDGSNSYIMNNADNGANLYVQNKSHGEKIILSCENTTGTEKTLLTLDPDVPKVQSCGAMISQMYNESLAANGVLVTSITEGSPGWFIIKDDSGKWTAYGVTCVASDTDIVIKYQTVSPPFFSTTKNSGPSNINLYFESGKLNIQNKWSYAKPIIFGFFGICIK